MVEQASRLWCRRRTTAKVTALVVVCHSIGRPCTTAIWCGSSTNRHLKQPPLRKKTFPFASQPASFTGPASPTLFGSLETNIDPGWIGATNPNPPPPLRDPRGVNNPARATATENSGLDDDGGQPIPSVTTIAHAQDLASSVQQDLNHRGRIKRPRRGRPTDIVWEFAVTDRPQVEGPATVFTDDWQEPHPEPRTNDPPIGNTTQQPRHDSSRLPPGPMRRLHPADGIVWEFNPLDRPRLDGVQDPTPPSKTRRAPPNGSGQGRVGMPRTSFGNSMSETVQGWRGASLSFRPYPAPSIRLPSPPASSASLPIRADPPNRRSIDAPCTRCHACRRVAPVSPICTRCAACMPTNDWASKSNGFPVGDVDSLPPETLGRKI